MSFLAGTGTRFGEATALQVADLDLTAAPPTARTCRAWKKGGKGVYLGGTKGANNRTIALPRPLARQLGDMTAGRPADALVFTSRAGARIQSHHFSTRAWKPSLARAQEASGMLGVFRTLGYCMFVRPLSGWRPAVVHVRTGWVRGTRLPSANVSDYASFRSTPPHP